MTTSAAKANRNADIVDRLEAENERLTAALKQCAAPFDTGPTTVHAAGEIIAQELHRRMNIAGAALIGYRAVEQEADENVVKSRDGT